MQVALKSICNYPTKSIKDLVTETSRLEIAGIKARPPVVKNDVFEVSANISLIDAITKRVLECIQSQNMETSLSPGENKSNSKSSEAFESVDYVSKSFNSGRYQGGIRYQGNQNKRRGKTRAYGFFTPTTQTHMKCRSCQSTGHGYRNCPNRFCQACGNRGHDAWDTKCVNSVGKRRQEKSNLYVVLQVHLNKIPRNAIIDSGAGVLMQLHYLS